MDTDIFSSFDQGDGGNQDFLVEGPDPLAPHAAPEGEAPEGGETEGSAGDGAPAGGETIQVKKEDWDRTQQVLAEFKGYMTAQQASKPAEPQRQAPSYDPQQAELQRQAQVQQQTQIDQFLNGLADDISSLDPARVKGALQKAIAAGAQLGAAQALQSASPTQQTTADLLVENFITRKAAKDPDAYDKVSETFEQRIAQIDPRVIAGYSRAQLNAVLDEMYDAELGRWARKQLTEAKNKRQQAQTGATQGRQQPTNFGGGRGTGGGLATPRGTIPEAWKKFALDAGIPESEITPDLFQGIEN